MAFPGAFLAKALVDRLPVHVHTAILDAVVIGGGAADGDRRAGAVTRYGHFTTGGSDDRIESTLPPVRRPKIVPRS